MSHRGQVDPDKRRHIIGSVPCHYDRYPINPKFHIFDSHHFVLYILHILRNFVGILFVDRYKKDQSKTAVDCPMCLQPLLGFPI